MPSAKNSAGKKWPRKPWKYTKKMKDRKKMIFTQMFDVRPVTSDGDLDLEKIQKIQKISQIEIIKAHKNLKSSSGIYQKNNYFFQGGNISDIKITSHNPSFISETPEEISVSQKNFSIPDDFFIKKNEIYQLGQVFDTEKVPIINKISAGEMENVLSIIRNEKEQVRIEAEWNDRKKAKKKWAEFKFINFFSLSAYPIGFSRKKFAFSFAYMACLIFLIILGFGFIKKGLGMKDSLLSAGQSAYASLAEAKDDILSKNFDRSSYNFNSAYEKFDDISKQMNDFGGIIIETTRFLPYLSKISSGKYLADAGKDISRIGILGGKMVESLKEIKNPIDSEKKPVSFLDIFKSIDQNSKEIKLSLDDAAENLNKINVDDIPNDQKYKFVDLKNQLPMIQGFINGMIDNSQIFAEVLGGNGPRKYIFLFQNNQEMRATGGFIGSYGILDIFNGRIRKFFVDGIFNPDGQLTEKVIPPIPIQKISAAWSLHDSNWFPNFPVSAEKAAWFYEKTGGPTVDGVITMTPTVMQKLLEITGPIEMPDYNLTVNSDNFVETVQNEVETNYDKEMNQPKKILADLAPLLLDKIFNAKNVSQIGAVMNALVESLNEKQILIYSKNYDIEKKLSEIGWSGEILKTRKDYISVINSNINGFKTDGVIDETIVHQAEIQDDGSVIDTVSITRHHNGGNSKFDWWNKVNADYMRVYVPKGSVLISADGQTREFNSPPLDYASLNFKHDPQIQIEDDGIKIDQDSGTRIYDEEEKTVFANWVYVSPQETVVIKYKYLLPFKIFLGNNQKSADTYSLLAQKQSGSLGSKFNLKITYPNSLKNIWKYPDDLKLNDDDFVLETDLKTDKFFGIALQDK